MSNPSTNTTTNTPANTVTPITAANPFDYHKMSTDNLARLGLVKVGGTAGKRAISELRKSGGFIFESDDISDTVSAVAIAANAVSTNVASAESRMHEAATLAGYIAKSGVHVLMHDAKGKPYKSVNQLFADLLPNLNKSTISRLIDAGMYVYIPALAGELPKEAAYIAQMSPSSIKSVLPLLKDNDKRDDAFTAIKAAAKEAGKSGAPVTARLLESAAKSVRKSDSNDTTPDTDTSESAANIAAQLSGNLTLPMVKKYVNAAVVDGELCMNIPEQHVPSFMELLGRAITDAVTANQIVGALYDISNAALKVRDM